MTILPFLYALTQAPATTPVPKWADEVLERWKGSGVKVTLKAKKCGDENAWYTFATRSVTLCTELFDRPDLARFVLNHELGHAFMHQNEIPWVDAEAAADQLAFIMSTDDEVYAAAKWFLTFPPRTEDSADGHPPGIDRAGSLLCLQSAHEGQGTRECRIYYRSVLADWSRWATKVAP